LVIFLFYSIEMGRDTKRTNKGRKEEECTECLTKDWNRDNPYHFFYFSVANVFKIAALHLSNDHKKYPHLIFHFEKFLFFFVCLFVWENHQLIRRSFLRDPHLGRTNSQAWAKILRLRLEILVIERRVAKCES
jgi:hypothetical protein